jgi:serine/threonine protein kinase
MWLSKLLPLIPTTVTRFCTNLPSINTSLKTLTGFAFVRAAFDDFIAISPTGAAHLCLVFEVMREPLSQFQHRLVVDSIPPQLLKVYVDFILQGLEYLHSDCQIIHTGVFLRYFRYLDLPILTASLDLKADNVLMSFEDPSVIEEYVNAPGDHPMPRKRVGDRNIYLSHNNFGVLKSYRMLPKIADFVLAHRADGEKPFRHPIQPPLYHAPEVLLGVPWSYSADIWNLGVFVSISRHIGCTDNN